MAGWFGSMAREEVRDKGVIVTGCDFDGGFGDLCVRALARQGFIVFAACFSKQGRDRIEALAASASDPQVRTKPDNEKELDRPGTALAQGARVMSVALDVTKESSVQECVTAVERGCEEEKCSLFALVNVAGMHDGALVDWTPVATYERVSQVNYVGLIRCCKAFLPHIKRAKGRIVNVTSMDGLRPLPGISAYACSKAAADAFSRTLGVEMAPFGVKVVTVNPGTYKTTMSAHGPATVKHVYSQADPDIKEQYGQLYCDKIITFTEHHTSSAAPDARPVANAVVAAITSYWPRRRYVVGNDAKWLWKPLRDCVPEAVFDRVAETLLYFALPTPSLST